MRNTTAPVRNVACLLSLSLSLCYMALAPCTTDGRGYIPEDKQAALGLLASFNAWVKGRPVPPISWTRHGPISLLLDLPFVKLGKAFVSPDFMLSLEPLLLTVAMLTILFVWLRKFCTPGISLLMTMIGAFGTMLWPYAYIGLETKQSFFVFLAGYLALAHGKIKTLPRLILFATACALAISVKSTGIVLAPPVAYLVYVQFRDDWRSRRKHAAITIGIIASIWTVGAIGWGFYWNPKGGGVNALGPWTTHSPLQLFSNALGLFGSPTKGLFLFAPVLLLAFYAIPRALRANRDVVVFALLTTACMVAFLSILIVSADEVWGPRFLHVAIAPMLVVIAVAIPRFQWRTGMPLLFLGAVGLSISFLGAFYYYGYRPNAAAAANQNTLEWLAGDPVWNEVQFDARLLGSWLTSGSEPIYWTPSHVWAWEAPPGVQPWKPINLRDYDDPQSFLVYYWPFELKGSDLLVFRLCFLCLLTGPAFLAVVILRTIRTPTSIVESGRKLVNVSTGARV